MKNIDQLNLDWYRNKTVDVEKRGNLALVAPVIQAGQFKDNKVRQKFVWPSSFDLRENRYLSHRVWGR